MVKRRFLKMLSALAFTRKDTAKTNTSVPATTSAEPDHKQDVLETAQTKFGITFETCDGKAAFKRWQELRVSAPDTVYPVIMGSEDNMIDALDKLGMGEDTNFEGVEAGDYAFPQKFLEYKDAEASDYYDVEEDSFNLSKAVEDVIEMWVDEPYLEPLDEPTVVRDFKGRYLETVYIALIPTPDWTTLPAILKFGGWNDCPADEWHIAALRHWDRQYGLELISMTHDVMELRAKHRPQMQKEAVTLAMEQFYYCSDIITQGVDEPQNLAKMLMQNNIWYFWWD